MIYYKKGNLLECTETTIIHQVNCRGVMNSGVAKAIREAYPKVYTDYLELEASSTLLGCVQYVEVDNKIIVNLFGQDNYRPRTVRHTSYDALEEGFRKIKRDLKGNLAIPKIGCGLGGGDWRIVSAIIETVFDDRDVIVYEL